MPSTATLTAVEYDGTGAVVPTPTLSWLSLNTGVFTVPIGGSGGSTAVVTATGVGSANGTCTDVPRSVSGGFVVNVSTSLGIVALAANTYLKATVGALAGDGLGLAILAMRMRFLVDPLLTVITGAAQDLEFMGVGDGTSNVTFGVGAEIDSSRNCTILCTGFLPRFTIAQSTLPAAGTYVIVAAGLNAGAGVFAVELLTDAGTGLGSASGSWSGNTNPAYTTVFVGSAGTGAAISGGITVDGVEIVAGPVSAPQTPPLPTDPNAIGLWGFAGVLTPTAGIGSAFTPAVSVGVGPPSLTYLSGGIWS